MLIVYRAKKSVCYDTVHAARVVSAKRALFTCPICRVFTIPRCSPMYTACATVVESHSR